MILRLAVVLALPEESLSPLRKIAATFADVDVAVIFAFSKLTVEALVTVEPLGSSCVSPLI